VFQGSPPSNMSNILNKIARTANAPKAPPDEIEKNVVQALVDLENNVPELKSELRVLQISAAREVDVRGGKKAIVIFVPFPQLKAYHKIQQRFVDYGLIKSEILLLSQTDAGAREEIF